MPLRTDEEPTRSKDLETRLIDTIRRTDAFYEPNPMRRFQSGIKASNPFVPVIDREPQLNRSAAYDLLRNRTKFQQSQRRSNPPIQHPGYIRMFLQRAASSWIIFKFI